MKHKHAKGSKLKLSLFLLAVLFVVSCVPTSGDRLAAPDKTIGIKEANENLRSNNFTSIIIHGEELTGYLAVDGKTTLIRVSGDAAEIGGFLELAEAKRVPIHIVEESSIGYELLTLALWAVPVVLLASILVVLILIWRRIGRAKSSSPSQRDSE